MLSLFRNVREKVRPCASRLTLCLDSLLLYHPRFPRVCFPLIAFQVVTLTRTADGYHIHPEKISEEIARGTSVILTSNPRNPTGQVVKNPELAKIQDICRDRCTLIMDEFYGGYNYTSNCDGTTVSAAENIV